MNHAILVLRNLSDTELLTEINRLTRSANEATARLVAALAELDARRLYLGQGCSSMFTYCTQVLHLAEHAAFNRIEAARAARRFPIILSLLADGRLHLSAVRLLAPHLTEENHQSLLEEATHKSKRDVEQMIARLQPRPDAPSRIRMLPSRDTVAAAVPVLMIQSPTTESTPIRTVAPPAYEPARTPPPSTQALAPGRYKVQFTVSAETHDRLRRVQDLLRHRVPNGDVATIFDRALLLLLANLEKSKLASTERPRASSGAAKSTRHVPAAVRREVWKRDGGRCRFEGPAGRCAETGFLEFHHVASYARGGLTTIDNLELRCAAHNRYEAEQCFGLFVRQRTEKA